MMKVLFETERKVFINTLLTMRRSYLISYLVIFIVVGVMLYSLSKGIWTISPLVTDSIFEGILSYGFLIMFGFIFLLSVPQVFNNMYTTKDLELLFTLPIQTRHIFWVKYLKSFFGVPLFSIVLFMVPLVTFGIAIQASFLFYPMVLFVLLLVTSLSLSIAYLLNLIIIQIVPASRANEFVMVMSFLSGLLVYFVIMGPSLFGDEPLTDLLLSGLPSLPKWLPTSWGSSVLVESANGSNQFILPFIFLFALAVVSVVFSTSLVEKGFRTGWIQLSEGSRSKKKKRKKGMVYKVHHPIIAVGKKEWLAVRRDFREWLILMPVAIFFIIGMFSFFSSGVNLSDVREFNQISWPVGQVALMFLYSLTAGTIASSSIGREGAAFWRLESLPLTGRQIALGKLWISWLLPFIMLTLIEVIIGVLLSWSIWQFVLGIVIKGILSIGWITLGLWLGTIGAKYDPTNPQARLNFGVSLILFISSWIYLLIVMIPFAYILIPSGELGIPVDFDHGMTGFTGMIASVALAPILLKVSYPVMMTGFGILVGVLISLGLGHLFTSLAARRIDRGITINVISESSSKPLFGRKRLGRKLY